MAQDKTTPDEAQVSEASASTPAEQPAGTPLAKGKAKAPKAPKSPKAAKAKDDAKGQDKPEPAAPVTATPVTSGDESQPQEQATVETNSVKVGFSFELDTICGRGTIRPPFLVEIEMAEQTERSVRFLDQDQPQKGIRMTLPMPADPFKAGAHARELAMLEFNKFYGITKTEHPYNVQAVEQAA